MRSDVESAQVERFVKGIKRLMDECFETNYRAHGPLRVNFTALLDSKKKRRHYVRLESGWDENYGGRVLVETSPTGRVVTVHLSPEVKVVRDQS